jgi:lysophospholipase L1-like esterase
MAVRLRYRFVRLRRPGRLAMVGCALAMAMAAMGQQTVYQPPVPPPKNLAAAARPKDDWYITVQEKFDRYKGKSPKIIFDGDSITNRWETTGRDAWMRFADEAADFGIEGDRTENLLWRLSKGQVDGMDPKLVVLLIGTNNTGRDSAQDIADGVRAVVAEHEERCPHAHIVLMAIFPRGRTPNDPSRMKVEAVNRLISTLDDGQRVSFVDIGSSLIERDGTISATMMPDLLHPAAQGYVIWAGAIKPLVKKYLAVEEGTTGTVPSSGSVPPSNGAERR